MALVFLDLDETLLDGDSDYEWGQFLCHIGKVDRAFYENENERFYQEYLAGDFDAMEFLDFALKPLAENAYAELCQWRTRFIETHIRPMVKPRAHGLIERHREAGDLPVIITSTNRFITQPISELLQVEDLIATDLVRKDGEFTGEVEGIPCFSEGKVIRAEQWVLSHAMSMQGSYFYTDSYNDLPLLEIVEHPIVVDADKKLTEHAIENDWERISLRF